MGNRAAAMSDKETSSDDESLDVRTLSASSAKGDHALQDRWRALTAVSATGLLENLPSATGLLELPKETASGFKMVTMIINFLLAEAKTVILFLLGYRGVIEGAVYQYYMKELDHTMLQDLGRGNITISERLHVPALLQHYDSFSEFGDCLSGDISGAMKSFEYVYHGKCIHMSPTVPFGYLFMPVVMGCVIVLLLQLLALTRFYIHCCTRGLRSTYCSGRYLQFVWDMYESKEFKCVSTVLIVVALGCISLVLYLGCMYDNGVNFVKNQFMSLLGVVLGAIGFTQTYVPQFGKENKLFGQLVFKRNCLSMLLQTCSGFAGDLEHALYRLSLYGDTSELESKINYKELGFDQFDTSAQEAVLVMFKGDKVS